MIGVFLILIVLFLLMIGHELAHFLVARLFGFQTPVFGVGLPIGPHWAFACGKTQVRVHPLLIGAYAIIPELDPETNSQDGGPLNQQPELNFKDDSSGSRGETIRKFSLWKRLVVVLAGIGFYVSFSWLALFASLNIVGIANTRVIVQGLSSTNPIATKSGVIPGDLIMSIDSQQIATPNDAVSYLRSHPGTQVTVHIERQAQAPVNNRVPVDNRARVNNRVPIDITMTPDEAGKVGMALALTAVPGSQRVSLLDSFGLATRKFCDLATGMFGGAQKVLGGSSQSEQSGKAPRAHGIIAVIKFGADIINEDWRQLPLFVAMISLDLAILNLIPWPGLDGSHFLAVLINAVQGRPLRQTGVLRWLYIGAVVLAILTSGAPLCFLRAHQKEPGN